MFFFSKNVRYFKTGIEPATFWSTIIDDLSIELPELKWQSEGYVVY